MRNPFRESIVADPWNSLGADVPTIHQDVYSTCLTAIEQVRENKRSGAILIHGAAGSGKTHLLSRLRQQLALKLPTATDRNEALYVWVRLQTSPRMIWRTIRRTLVNDWFRPLEGTRCQFDRILFHRLAEFRIADGDLEPWYDYMLEENPQGLRELVEKIAYEIQLDRNTEVVFEHLVFGRFRRDLKAWLCGDSLPEAALEKMGMTQDEGLDEEREDQARQVVLMLCQLAGNELPVVLSFDQVEALETKTDDKLALFAFGQMVSTLHDGTSNVLIISSVQSSFSDRLLQDSRDADIDRLQSLGKFSLNDISQAEAEHLIRIRLEPFESELASERVGRPLWPLTNGDIASLFESTGSLTPRQLIARCAERFEEFRHTGSISDKSPTPPQEGEQKSNEEMSGFLKETWETTFEDKLAKNTPDETELIIQHGLQNAIQLLREQVSIESDEDLRDVAFVLQQASAATGVSICCEQNMTRLSGQLRRLKEQMNSDRIQRLVVLRDSRVPITATAKKAKAYLDDLKSMGAAVVYPTIEVLAALDTLRVLMSDAKSGDLAYRGSTIEPQTLREWLLHHMSQDVSEFVSEILADSEVVETPAVNLQILEELMTVMQDQPLLRLDELSTMTQREANEIVSVVQQHMDQFNLIGEPPELVFRVTQV